MTESEWLICTDPKPMLDFLVQNGASDRKLRLFASACTDGCGSDIAELFADGEATAKQMADAVEEAWTEWNETARDTGWNIGDFSERVLAAECDPDAHAAAYKTADLVATENARRVAQGLMDAGSHQRVMGRQVPYDESAIDEATAEEYKKTKASQAELLREILGNPFHPYTINPFLLAWNDGVIRKLAQTIYDEPAFDTMPILADALEEAGCDNADILNHLRGPGPHVRGCWVVDLLLGKEAVVVPVKQVGSNLPVPVTQDEDGSTVKHPVPLNEATNENTSSSVPLFIVIAVLKAIFVLATHH